MAERYANDGVSIILRDFSVHIQPPPSYQTIFSNINTTDEVLVQPISAQIPSSKLFAIFGGSGSGKTTLLNTIAGRYDRNTYSTKGTLLFSRSEDSSMTKKTCTVAYVTQEDYLHPFLTVRETILFTAKLRVPAVDDGSSHSVVVDSVIAELGLKECADNLVGSNDGVTAKRGISGGEKRRVSAALQILNHPEVLCADEPTSGLDSFTAITVMDCLKRLTIHRESSPGTTVVCSIHQPRADIFKLIDAVLVLSAGGQPVYCGSTEHMLDYFDKLGFACPEHANPADFFIDLTAIDGVTETDKKASLDRVALLCSAYQNSCLNNDEGDKIISKSQLLTLEANEPTAPISTQGKVLTERLFLCGIRDSSHFYGSLIQSTVLGLIVMGIFYQLPITSEGLSSRSGLMYIVVSMEIYMLMIILIEKYCYELHSVVDRELQDGLYQPSAYYAAHWVVSWPLLLVQAIVYSVPIYYGCGLRPGFTNFLSFLAVVLAMMMLINSLAWACVSLNRQFAVASLIGNMNFTFISLTAGFLVNFDSIPVYVSWVENISMLSYGYRLLMTTEFSDRTFTIQDGIIVYGNDVLYQYGVKVHDYLVPWLAILGIFVAYILVGNFALYYLRFPPTGSVGAVNKAEKVAQDFTTEEKFYTILQDIEKRLVGGKANKEGESKLDKEELAEPLRGITIQAINLHLNVYATFHSSSIATNANNKPLEYKKLLKSINFASSPGKLVAIMGGSGSGKTTLLNLLANRIPHSSLSLTTNLNSDSSSSSSIFNNAQGTYFGSGELLFNNHVLKSSELRNCLAYVQQFDFHLPSLTVFETLLFHARLRFKHCVDYEQMLKRRVYEVLYTLNLTSCAHIRVGDGEVKGISGGEKRRLSIAIQLLVSPAICLLDEPTTGLDAYTARRVVHLLRHIAHTPYRDQENIISRRCVILSIHQPRYDIFSCFDEVLLLSRGELVWAGTSSEMYTHFEKIGHPFPLLCNPADYLLDISSIDFRSEELENETKKRLEDLISAFKVHQAQVLKDAENGCEGGEMSSAQSVKKVTREQKAVLLAVPLLLHRSFTNLYRQPLLITNRISQGLFYGLILCCFYAPIGDDQKSIQNRIGNLYELTAICFIGMLSCIAIYPMERDVFYREYPDGYYSAVSFILCYFIISIPLLVGTALGIGALITYAVGLAPDSSSTFQFMYSIFTFIFVGECLGVIFCSAFYHVGFAVNIMSAVLSFFSIMSGYISLNMPVALVYISYISPLMWGSFILSNLTFDGQTFSCDDADTGVCLTTGEEVLGLYDLNKGNGTRSLSFHYYILTLITVLYFIAAIVAVRLRAKSLSH